MVGERVEGNATVQEVEGTLRRLLEEIAHIDPKIIRGSSTLENDIQLRSIAFVEIQTALEDIFDIELDPVEVIERNNFAAIVDLIAEKVIARPC